MRDEHADIKEEWKAAFKAPPPFRTNPDFMRGHLEWIRQAKEHGGLKRKINAQIKDLVSQLRDGVDLIPDHTLIIKPGTRMIRLYQGVKHEVIATEKGFLYKDKEYGSLSVIARSITGRRWNGKVFFGVKKR